MKKFTKICAAALAAVCTVGLAGCSSSGSTSALTSKWYIRTNYPGIQNTAIYTEGGENAKEALVYDITFEEGSNTVYSVNYNEGSQMTTEFYACEYDWSDTLIPDGYQSDETETVYCYKYSFELSGTYTFTETGETVDFTDSTESVCYFRSVRNDLQPVYSYQNIVSTTPRTFSPATANENDMYNTYNYQYTCYYNKDCTEVTTYYSEYAMSGLTENVIDLSDTEYTLFDNGSIYAAIRAMTITSSLSSYVDIFIPSEEGYSAYVVSGSDAATLEDETIKSALVNAGYVNDGDEVTYSAATLTYTGDLSGTSQTIWYAAMSDDVDANYCRSTMLKIELPLSFSLGTLNFTLSEVTSHFNV